MKKMSKRRQDAMHYVNLICGGAGISPDDLVEAYFDHAGDALLSECLKNADKPENLVDLFVLAGYDITREDPSAKSSFDTIQGKITSNFCNEENIEFFESNVINKDLDENGNIVDFTKAKEIIETKKNEASLGFSKAA